MAKLINMVGQKIGRWSVEKTLTTPVRERRGKNDKCN